ncbi:hypothetical protein DFP72DRAFT_624700 [Ephemerocybe angulata]|uniref:Uncharacterized protein n=1 Tax=Ephemerocybe angulata TaxID=980116 RepID=A0A8H6I9R5_9AGAR|nr:hypothetical protein DFP72DRAFT_624700 [Tulosesus angulatus]
MAHSVRWPPLLVTIFQARPVSRNASNEYLRMCSGTSPFSPSFSPAKEKRFYASGQESSHRSTITSLRTAMHDLILAEALLLLPVPSQNQPLNICTTSGRIYLRLGQTGRPSSRAISFAQILQIRTCLNLKWRMLHHRLTLRPCPTESDTQDHPPVPPSHSPPPLPHPSPPPELLTQEKEEPTVVKFGHKLQRRLESALNRRSKSTRSGPSPRRTGFRVSSDGRWVSKAELLFLL